MKKLALIAALAMTFASQAFAQSYDHDFGGGNVANPVQAEGTNAQFGIDTGAYASGSYDTVPAATFAESARRFEETANELITVWPFCRSKIRLSKAALLAQDQCLRLFQARVARGTQDQRPLPRPKYAAQARQGAHGFFVAM